MTSIRRAPRRSRGRAAALLLGLTFSGLAGQALVAASADAESEGLRAAPASSRSLDRGSAAAKADPLAGLDAWICGSALEGRPTSARVIDAFRAQAADPEAPWAAKLEIVEERFENGGMTLSNCSAAAVSARWLVTAAHCVGQEGWISVEATLGAADASGPYALRRTASLALCHERFDPRDLAYDVALLRLDEPLPRGFPVLRLATESETDRLSRGDAALSAGWGRIGDNEISQELRKAAVEVVDPARNGDGMIVAAPVRHEESLCVGESGAPLVADLGSGPALFGVFSSVDAYHDPRTDEMIELCHGFEARSYFTALRGLQSWVLSAIDACDGDPARCARSTPEDRL